MSQLFETVYRAEARTEEGEATGADPIPLAAGRWLQLPRVGADDIVDHEERARLILQAMRDEGLTERPCVALDLAALRDLGLVLKEDGSVVGDGKVVKESFVDPDADLKDRPPAAKLIVPAKQLVDLRFLTPPAGRSVVRCNAAVPAYQWFRSMNLLLQQSGKTNGRVIPFPLETEVSPEQRAKNGGQARETIYHVLRVGPAEFEGYQTLLKEAIDNDGIDQGFYHASKFAYEVLQARGYKKLDEAAVGDAVTNVILMGNSYLRGVLVGGWHADDFEDEVLANNGVFV